MLLRTHTSPVQIRTMTSKEPPIRIIAPGRVYRSDSDATHTPMFHQIEGLVIDKGIHLGHLKWTLETFLKAFFERDDVVLRLRPSYFPFTEPSVEVDVGYSVVKGKRVIGGSEGWMEVLGSGMVHRKVIELAGLIPMCGRALPSAPASTGWRCSNMAWTICAPSSMAIIAGSSITGSTRSMCPRSAGE
jgi:phenylalanyl-tRNA synthetase alpha chain